jgi:hypothetical protein
MRGRDGRVGRVVGGAVFLAAGTLLAHSMAGAQERVELPAVDRELAWEVEEIRRVGGLAGPGWSQFGRLSRAAFGSHGELLLLDVQAPAVVEVAPDGSSGRRIGGPGEGPGEYRLPTGIAVAGDGTRIVWASRKRAFLLYGPDGTLLREVGASLEAGIPSGRPLAPTHDGAVRSAARKLLMNGRHAFFTSGGVQEAKGRLPLLHIPLTREDSPSVVTELRLPVWEGPGDPPPIRALEVSPSWGPLARGALAVHDSEGWTVEILDTRGRPVRTLHRPLELQRVDARVRRQVEAYWASEVGRGFTVGPVGGRPPESGERLREMAMADRVPAVRRIATDGHGVIWVERPHPDDPTRPGPVDLVTAHGRYLGTLSASGPGIPDAFGPDGLAVYLVEEGPLEVPVARVVRLGSGLRAPDPGG